MSSPRSSLSTLGGEIVRCRACPRLVAWREEVARGKRRAYAAEEYWGRPVPGFGDPMARLVVLGLAPAAHGANRTGRVFTGDRSGDFLFAALHRAGLASQPVSKGTGDGLQLRGAYVLVAVRCAPPGNHPDPQELEQCAPFLDREIDALAHARVVLALGAIAWSAYLGYLRRRGHRLPRPLPSFAHRAELLETASHPRLIGSYHVSQQNTQTGRLTPAMFDEAVQRAIDLAA